jgi:Concanavalin A-like lectin/glucanases superfamily
MPITINGGFVLTGGMSMGNLAGLATGVGAWNFDGNNDLQIWVEPNPYTGDSTIEMWVKPTGTSTSPIWWIPVDYVDSSDYNKLRWYLTGSTITVESRPKAGGASTFTPISTTLNLNEWNYICFAVINGVAILYVNGTLVGHSTTHTYTYRLNAWFVGYDTAVDPFEFFSGQITNLRLSNTDIYNLSSLPGTMPVPTGQLTVQNSTLVLYTMSDPNANIVNLTDDTDNAFTNAGSPPTWVSSTPGPY